MAGMPPTTAHYHTLLTRRCASYYSHFRLSLPLASLETCLMQSICNATRVYERPLYTLLMHVPIFIAIHKFRPFPADQSVLSLKEDRDSPKYNTTPSMHAYLPVFCVSRVCLSLPMGVIKRNDLSIPQGCTLSS